MQNLNNFNKKTTPKPPSILLADDDRLVLSTFTLGLEQAGFHMIKASNGSDALRLCMEKQPDLAILDINMPDMSGLKVAEKLVENSNIPFMFLTAYSDKEFVDAADRAGAMGFLVKPITFEQIVPEIQLALSRAQALFSANQVAEKLNATIDTTKTINLAVGIIMERYKLPSREAFERIRTLARSQRKKINALALEISDAENNLNKYN